MIDRIAPTIRPEGRNSGTQRWQSLLFAHWQLPAESIAALLPRGLELDTYQSKAYVGIVPFQMQKIRTHWAPKFVGVNFLETNLRTYVVCKGRPGVYFFSLDAGSRLAVWLGSTGWSLPYHHAHMTRQESQGQITYQSQRSGGQVKHLSRFRIGDQLGPSKVDTLEHFLFERYLLFVQRGDQIHVGQVSHDPYDVWTANVDRIDDDLATAAGLPQLSQSPDLTHYSPGVDVEVFGVRPT